MEKLTCYCFWNQLSLEFIIIYIYNVYIYILPEKKKQHCIIQTFEVSKIYCLFVLMKTFIQQENINQQ